MDMEQSFGPGEIVYITQLQSACTRCCTCSAGSDCGASRRTEKIGSFSHDNYYPLTDEFAIFSTEEDAEMAYKEAFGSVNDGGYQLNHLYHNGLCRTTSIGNMYTRMNSRKQSKIR